MKNINKISLIIIILILISLIFSSYSQASEISDIFSGADEFLSKGDAIGNTIKESQLKETSNFMYKLLMAIGIIVMFLVGTIIGIQYMVASAEDKAKVKEALVPYIVGCFVIFGAFTIWSIAVNIGQDTVTGTVISKYYCSNCKIELSGEFCYNCHAVVSKKAFYKCENCQKYSLSKEQCTQCGKTF